MRTQPVASRVFSPAGTYFTESFYDDMDRDFASASAVEALSGTSPTATVTLQESPSPSSLADGSAAWMDLVSHTLQNAVGIDAKKNTTPHFTRKRYKVVVGGSATPSVTLSTYLEGPVKDR